MPAGLRVARRRRAADVQQALHAAAHADNAWAGSSFQHYQNMIGETRVAPSALMLWIAAWMTKTLCILCVPPCCGRACRRGR